MESASLPQKEPQDEPGPGEQSDAETETGADDVPPAEGTDDDAVLERGDE